MPQFVLIASIDKNNMIGVNGNLAYHCPEDMRRFKSLTINAGCVLMGLKTWESLPKRPLPDRHNIVLTTTQKNNKYNNTTFISNIQELFPKFENTVIYCIGGQQVYHHLLSRYRSMIAQIILTKFDITSNNCDEQRSYFPSEFLHQFKITQCDSTQETVTDWKGIKYDINVSFTSYMPINTTPVGEVGYLETMRKILSLPLRQSRNGNTHSGFGFRIEYDCTDYHVPLITSKKMAWRTVIKELLWFIGGQTDNSILQSQNVHIWDGNSSEEFLKIRGLCDYKEGDCGPIYGHQWRHSGAQYIDCKTDYSGKGVDQLSQCECAIVDDPHSRRIIICAWNPVVLDKMVLPPCHVLCQFYVDNDNRLSLQLYQRSGDMFLGVPFNIFSYAVLLLMMAQRTSKLPGKLIHILGDAHVYEEHVNVAREQLAKPIHQMPRLEIRSRDQWEDYTIDDFSLLDYNCESKLSAPMIA